MHSTLLSTKLYASIRLLKNSLWPLVNYRNWFTLLFFSLEKELFSWTYLLKKAPQRTKILISPVWNKTLKIWDIAFELIQIEVQCSKNCFKIFLPQEAGAFGNNIEEEPQKLGPKFKKYVHYMFTENIFSTCNPMQVVGFCKWL